MTPVPRVGHLSDRRRVELLLIVDQFAHFVRTGANVGEDEEAVRCLDLLAQTRAELTNGRQEDARVFPRLVRIDRDHFAPLRQFGQPVAAFGLVVYMLLERLTAADYLVVPEDGPFREALGILLPALSPIAGEPGRWEDASARTDGVIEGLKSEGYFRELRDEPGHG